MVKIEHPVFSMVEPGDTVRQKNGLCGVFECFILKRARKPGRSRPG